MDHKLVLATLDDIDEILSLYHHVIETTFTTWGDDYPNRELLENDIMSKSLYVLKSQNDIIGVSFFGIKENDDESWIFPLSNPMSVARICVSPEHQGKGVGTYLMHKLVSLAKEKGADGMHFHVCTQNPSAMKMYEKAGFKNTGPGKSNYGFEFFKYEQIFKK